jgi:hypothetical protein
MSDDDGRLINYPAEDGSIAEVPTDWNGDVHKRIQKRRFKNEVVWRDYLAAVEHGVAARATAKAVEHETAAAELRKIGDEKAQEKVKKAKAAQRVRDDLRRQLMEEGMTEAEFDALMAAKS